MRSTERVKAAARDLGLDISIAEMPASTRTAEEAAAACRTSVDRIVKSLLFTTASGAPLLVLVSGANQVDPAVMAGHTGEALTRMEARTVREVTGFAIGGVAPIGSITPLHTFMDADLLNHATVWAAAGAPQAVFEVDPNRLAAATGAKIVRVS